MQQHVVDQDLTTQPIQADIPSKRHKNITSGATSRVRLKMNRRQTAPADDISLL